MSFQLWLAFAIASAILVAIPGPTVMLVVSYALGQGRRTAIASVPGVTLGDFSAMTASLLGAGAILAASAMLFTILKLVGAVYLIWLGLQLWRAAPAGPGIGERPETGPGTIFGHAFAVTALNPKSIVFFIAFVPQFVVPENPLLPQFLLLEATFLALATLNAAIWALLAAELRARFRNPRLQRLFNRVGGSLLIGAGAALAAARR